MGLDNDHAACIVLPTRIISQKPSNIVYKNRSGQYVTLSVANGKERILISNSL